MTTAITISQKEIENRISTIRGIQVMKDKDLAEIYQVETKVLNQAVKRNSARFPKEFRFQLTESEYESLNAQLESLNKESLRSQFVTLKTGRGQHRKYLPFVFTEQGVAMLSAVLRSETAVKVSIQIMQAFVDMRKLLLGHAALFQRLDKVEYKQIEADHKFEQIFKALENTTPPDKGLFYDGQIFDAWRFVSDLMRRAKHSIILIDNYVDDTVLGLFTKRRKDVSVTIYTKTISRQLATDLAKHNAQHDPIVINELKDAHDRFLIIDDSELYHIGASLKDLGKKWFAFSKMDVEVFTMLEELKKGKK